MPQDDYIGILAASGRHGMDCGRGSDGSGQRWEAGLPEGAKWIGTRYGTGRLGGGAGRGMWTAVDWGSSTVGRRVLGTPLDSR